MKLFISLLFLLVMAPSANAMTVYVAGATTDVYVSAGNASRIAQIAMETGNWIRNFANWLEEYKQQFKVLETAHEQFKTLTDIRQEVQNQLSWMDDVRAGVEDVRGIQQDAMSSYSRVESLWDRASREVNFVKSILTSSSSVEAARKIYRYAWELEHGPKALEEEVRTMQATYTARRDAIDELDRVAVRNGKNQENLKSADPLGNMHLENIQRQNTVNNGLLNDIYAGQEQERAQRYAREMQARKNYADTYRHGLDFYDQTLKINKK